MIDHPSIEAVKALDGKILAMLNQEEQATLKFYQGQGRKYGVKVDILSKPDPVELGNAKSQEDAERILKSANSRVIVTVT